MLQPYLVDLDQADVSMQEAEATQPAANPQRPATLIFNRPAAFSNSIPVYLAPKAHLLDLQERLRSIYFPSRIVSSLFIPPFFWPRFVCLWFTLLFALYSAFRCALDSTNRDQCSFVLALCIQRQSSVFCRVDAKYAAQPCTSYAGLAFFPDKL